MSDELNLADLFRELDNHSAEDLAKRLRYLFEHPIGAGDLEESIWKTYKDFQDGKPFEVKGKTVETQ